jgi:hypothetical protein
MAMDSLLSYRTWFEYFLLPNPFLQTRKKKGDWRKAAVAPMNFSRID